MLKNKNKNKMQKKNHKSEKKNLLYKLVKQKYI